VKVAPCLEKLCSGFESTGVRGIVLDLYSDGEEHLYRLRPVRRRYPAARVIVATAFPSFRSAVSAIRLGADDYIAKPVGAADLTQMLDGRHEDVAQPASFPSLHRMEWEYIQCVLRHTGGNISAAARMLEVERSTLQRKLRKHPPER
jgi:two-component system response regulator RegA